MPALRRSRWAVSIALRCAEAYEKPLSLMEACSSVEYQEIPVVRQHFDMLQNKHVTGNRSNNGLSRTTICCAIHLDIRVVGRHRVDLDNAAAVRTINQINYGFS
jgi:hypothetical protein